MKKQKTRSSSEHPRSCSHQSKEQSKEAYGNKQLTSNNAKRAHIQVEEGDRNTQAGALLTFREDRENLRERLVVTNLIGGFKEKLERGWMTDWQREHRQEIRKWMKGTRSQLGWIWKLSHKEEKNSNEERSRISK